MKMNEKGRIEVNMEEAYLDDLENRLNATAYIRLLQAARECQNNVYISTATIEKWINHPYWGVRYGAMYAAIDRPEVPYRLIEIGLNDTDCDVRMIALRACACRNDVPIERYDEALSDRATFVAEAAAKSIKGKHIPPEIKADWAISHNSFRRLAAANAL